MSDITNQDILELNTIKNLYIQYGRFCEYYEITDSDSMFNYELYLSCGSIEWNIDNKEFESVEENQLYTFLRRLKIGEYKAIIINERTPLILEDKSNIEFWENQLYCDLTDSIIEVGYDTLKIINKHNDETVLLEGLEEISKGEIFTRQYLDNCEGDLIVKDSLEQIELREDNFVKDIIDYYNKCKDIVNIRTVPEDDEHYKMNWDCIIVGFGEGIEYVEEIWQRA